jgi:hypothetical protein
LVKFAIGYDGDSFAERVGEEFVVCVHGFYWVAALPSGGF